MTKNNIFFISLGCDKNRVDSEEMLGLLKAAGFSFTDNEYDADIIVINTCCFIDDAKTESIEAILEMAKMKTEGRCKRLVVSGCLSERYKDELLQELPEVDAYIGTGNLYDIIKACNPDSEYDVTGACDYFKSDNRVITTSGFYEYLKIAEGCNKYCSYCIIPYIRGNFKSYPLENLVNEARYLCNLGVKELIVVAQETSIYGKDLYGKECLPDLLRELCKIDGLEWIRVLYCYPEDITEDFLKVMADEDKICKYIDMPIQHASDNVLKAMGRKTDYKGLIDVIEKTRSLVPDVVLRTSLIAGFPGETEEDYGILCDFVKKIKFDHLGVFAYSQEDGTRAAKMDNQISDDVKIKRQNGIMEIQEQIAFDNLQQKIGKVFKVIIEGRLTEDDVYVGRTYMDAPDVDGLFYLECNEELMSGDFVLARATDSSSYDLYGEFIKKL